MARYKVVFSRSWILGRWGFTDRVLHGIGGRPAEPSFTQPAWLVEFRGSPQQLGQYLTRALQISLAHDPKDGAVFDIQPLDGEVPPPPRRSRAPGSARRAVPRLRAPRP